ncbi:MAG: DUF2867 domain-containing protein [Halorhodospira sp.]
MDSDSPEQAPSAPAPAGDAAPLYAVFGASGYIGSHLVPELLRAGCRVRAIARNREVLAARGWEGAELAAADALRPETLPEALAGADIAYYLVHSMGSGKDFGRLDIEAARNFAHAAAEAGVRRIVYLGGLVPESASSAHILSRQQTGDTLREGRVPVTELRAGIIVGPGSAAFEVMRDLVLHLPVMVTPRWVFASSPPIALQDLLEYLRRAPQAPGTAGRILDVAGPEHLTYAQMMRTLAEEAGRRPPRIIPVPLLSPKLSSYWLRLITAVPTPIARALIEGLREDYTADDSEIRQLVPQQLLDFRSAVQAVFRAERENAVAARWTEGAFMFRDYRVDHSYHAKKASGSATTSASPAAAWSVVTAIGGSNRYYYANALWKIRETLDGMLGGPGRNYGRRHPTELRIGDMVDSWRVIGLEPERRLTLWFGMRAPGSGVMEIELKPLSEGGTQITVSNHWHPAGVWGLLYWYALYPAHSLVFSGLARAIGTRAEALSAASGARSTTPGPG